MSFRNSGTQWRMKSPVGSAWIMGFSIQSTEKQWNSRLQALVMGIEDAEVGTWVDARTRTPLPSTVVGSKITINQLLHEVLVK